MDRLRLSARIRTLETALHREGRPHQRQVLILDDAEYDALPDGTSLLCLAIGPGESVWARKGEGLGEGPPCICWVE